MTEPITRQALAQIISRSQHRPRTALPFLGGLSLARARVHEFCGPARRTLALMAARSVTGPVIWIRPGWLPERLYPDGVLPLIEPGRLIFVTPRRPEDLLWCFEEALRAGAVALVVGELPEPPGLTPVRRLNLAAETGATEGAQTPTGLILTPGHGGAQGVESRWHIAPRHSEKASRWQLDLCRARSEPPQRWSLTPAPAGQEGFVLTRDKGPGEPASDGPDFAGTAPVPG
jgi:protein ImuA